MQLLTGLIFSAAVRLAWAQAGLILHLPLTDTSGGQARDISGSNRNANIMGNPGMTADGLRLDGRDDYVQLPNDLLRNLQAVTVSIQVNIAPQTENYYFIWGIGNTGRDGRVQGNMFTTGTPLRGAISLSDYQREANVRARGGRGLPPNEWHTLTYVVDYPNRRAALYLDGNLVGDSVDGELVSPADIGGGSTRNNYIGRSLYPDDNYFGGWVRDFRIYNRALSRDEIPLLLRPPQQQQPQPQPPSQPPTGDISIGQALTSINLGDLNNVVGNINFPKRIGNIQINWGTSNPGIISTDGVVTRPPTDTLVTLVAIADSDGQHGERTFIVNVRGTG